MYEYKARNLQFNMSLRPDIISYTDSINL